MLSEVPIYVSYVWIVHRATCIGLDAEYNSKYLCVFHLYACCTMLIPQDNMGIGLIRKRKIVKKIILVFIVHVILNYCHYCVFIAKEHYFLHSD